jgi:RNA polymerase sigma factor (sigma-70 family)
MPRSSPIPAPRPDVRSVRELPLALEPVSRDPFIDGLTDSPRPQPDRPALAAAVRAAVAGDGRAMAALVARFDPMLRSVARGYRLDPWDADDVVQATWLQFLQHGATLREPAAVSGWLCTTARRTCLRVLQSRVRERLTDTPLDEHVVADVRLDAALLAAERRTALTDSLAELNERQRELISLLLDEPDLSYEDVGRRLGLPIGSIGPTRARSLSRLRDDRRLQALT